MNPNNNSHIPHNGCGLMLMPMKEVFEHMHADVLNAQNALAFAESAKAIRHILSEIYQYQVDSRVPEHIKHMIQDIKGSVHGMHMHDFTREQMCNNLAELVTTLEYAIAQEEHAEYVKGVRRFFMIMADHAEEIVSWLEEYEKQ